MLQFLFVLHQQPNVQNSWCMHDWSHQHWLIVQKMSSFCLKSMVWRIQPKLQESSHSSFAPWHCLLPVCMFLDPIYVHGSWDTCRVHVSSNQRGTPDDWYVCKIRKWVHPLCLWYNTIGKVYEQRRLIQLVEFGRWTFRIIALTNRLQTNGTHRIVRSRLSVYILFGFVIILQETRTGSLLHFNFLPLLLEGSSGQNTNRDE